MTARRESFKGQFLVKGFPTSSGRSDPARRMTDGIFVASYVGRCRIDYRAAPHHRRVWNYVILQDLTLIYYKTVAGAAGHTYFVKVLIHQGTLTDQLFLVNEELAHGEMGPLRLMDTCHTTQGCVPSLNK